MFDELEEFHDDQSNFGTDDEMQWIEPDIVDDIINHARDLDCPSSLLNQRRSLEPKAEDAVVVKQEPKGHSHPIFLLWIIFYFWQETIRVTLRLVWVIYLEQAKSLSSFA